MEEEEKERARWEECTQSGASSVHAEGGARAGGVTAVDSGRTAVCRTRGAS